MRSRTGLPSIPRLFGCFPGEQVTKGRALVAMFVILLLAIGVNGYFGVSAYDRTSGKATSNCREIEVVKQGLRETLQEAQTFVQTSHVRSSAEKTASLKFYDDAIARVAPHRC